jgi:UDP-2-acetamido-3-amino-2,3-dideoxy-glucuronate N-acetyltransferase
MIHNSSVVTGATVGEGTSIWQHVVVSPGAVIGRDCNVCSHCFIETGVIIGDRVTIKNGVSLWTGVSIDVGVFVGPGVTFCNDKFPRSKVRPDSYLKTRVSRGASIGSGAVFFLGL